MIIKPVRGRRPIGHGRVHGGVKGPGSVYQDDSRLKLLIPKTTYEFTFTVIL